MRIGIDIRPLASDKKTGIGEYTYELVDALFSLESDHEFFLFSNACKLGTQIISPEWAKKTNVHLVSKRIPNKILHGAIASVKWPKIDRLTAANLDVFFSPNIHFTSVGPNTRHVLTVHDLSFEHFPDCYSFKRRMWHRVVGPKKQCERADMILTPSKHTKRDIVGTYGIAKEKVRVLRPGLAPHFFEHESFGAEKIRAAYRLPEKYILFLGTVEPRKNIAGLIDAFVKSGLNARGYTLIIAGATGWKAGSIMKKIRETDGVRSIGYVRAEEKPMLYRLADLFVYPSFYEGFGFPILEAMASGTPVITSNRSSLPEVAGGAAMLVNPLNFAEIAGAMTQVLSDTTLSGMLSRKGVVRAGQFHWRDSARGFISICEAL